MAVKVYWVNRDWEADMRACVVKNRQDAQMVVYPVRESWDAQTKLYLVPNQQDAELKVYVAQDPGEE